MSINGFEQQLVHFEIFPVVHSWQTEGSEVCKQDQG